MLVVQVETDAGIAGAGISRDAERFAVRELIRHEIGPFLLGKDPLATEKIWNDACWELGMSYKVRTRVVARAIGAVDQALWDIKGRYLHQPIYRLLGGASPASVGAYTTFGFNVYPLEDLVALARQLVQEGHDKLKMQVVAADRGQDVSVDVARVKAVREAVGDPVMLMVDGNSKFDFPHARELARRIEPYHIQPPVARQGRLPLPEKPGMGLELNEAAVEEYTEP